MRPSSLSVLILLAIATTPLLAQRPAPPTPGSRPASGTPGSAPSGAAPFARPPAGSPQSRASNLPGGGGDPNADSSLRRVVRERAGVTPPEHPPGASPPPPPVPPAGGPLPLPVPKPPVRPVTPSVAEDFLASLAGRAARAKTLNFAFEVRFLAADGSSSAVEIRGLSSRPGALLHRQRLSFSDGKVLTDVMLIHEVAGERPLAWHRGKAGEVLAYAGDPFAAAPGDAPGFQLLDVLFFDPAHYNLEVRGESELEGQPTMVVSGRPRFGRVEQLEFSFHRYRGNLLRTTATDAAGTLLFEARDEEFRESGGLLAGARRRIVRPGDGAMLVVHRKQWDVDPKLDGTLLEPATFLR